MAEMDREKPITMIVEGPVGVRIENEILTALQSFMGAGGSVVSGAASGAGEPLMIVLMRGRTLSGDDEPIALEDNRDLRNRLILDDGAAAPIRWQAFSATGEANVMLHGTNDGAAPLALMTDAQRLVRQRGFEPWRFVASVAPAPGAGYSTVYTVPANTLLVTEVTVIATAGAPLIDVHLVPNAGAVGADNAIFISAAPSLGHIPLRDGPYELEAGGTVQVRNTAAAGNTGNVRLWVELFSTGDTV